MLGAYLLSVRSTEPTAVSQENTCPFGELVSVGFEGQLHEEEGDSGSRCGHRGGSVAVQWWEGFGCPKPDAHL